MRLTCFIIALFVLPYSQVYAQKNGSEEWIKIYFNMPADFAVADEGNRAHGNADLIGTLETLINTADQATLELLPGIGPSYAKRIIEFREQNGGFTDVSELMEVKGIGEKRFEKIRAFVTL